VNFNNFLNIRHNQMNCLISSTENKTATFWPGDKWHNLLWYLLFQFCESSLQGVVNCEVAIVIYSLLLRIIIHYYYWHFVAYRTNSECGKHAAPIVSLQQLNNESKQPSDTSRECNGKRIFQSQCVIVCNWHLEYTVITSSGTPWRYCMRLDYFS